MTEKKINRNSGQAKKTSLSKEAALGQLENIARKEKWHEQDLTDFIQTCSLLLHFNEEDVKKFYSILLQVPQSHLPRVLYYIVNQRFIDFISRKSNVSFRFISSLNNDLIQFIKDWSNLEEDTRLLDMDDDVRALLSEKICVKYVKPHKNSRNLEWESLKKIDRMRLLYSLVILEGGLNSSKINQIHQSVLILFSIIAGGSHSTKNSKSLLNFDCEFRKLQLYFDEIQGNTSEESIKSFYMLEFINNTESESLIAEHKYLSQENQLQKKKIEDFKLQIEQLQKENEENKRIINSQESNIELLRKDSQDWENAYARLKESSRIRSQSEINALFSNARKDLEHQLVKLQRGLDKYIKDDKVKAQFGQIISKIENVVQMKE